MIRVTASRQEWSSLRTWERKPQRVVTGLKTRSRYVTPCSSRASWIRASVRTSANARPSLRAKRARSRSRLVLVSARASRGGLIERESEGSIRWVIIPFTTAVYRPMFTLQFKASAIRVVGPTRAKRRPKRSLRDRSNNRSVEGRSLANQNDSRYMTAGPGEQILDAYD